MTPTAVEIVLYFLLLTFMSFFVWTMVGGASDYTVTAFTWLALKALGILWGAVLGILLADSAWESIRFKWPRIKAQIQRGYTQRGPRF